MRLFTCTTESVGIHILLICYLRLTTALLADEQSDTHAIVLLLHPKVCDEDLTAFPHTTGLHFQHTRDINSALSLASNLRW